MQTWTPVKKLVKRFTGYFPEQLPASQKDYEKFSKNIFDAYSLPDMPGYHQAIATLIMHLSPTTDKKSRNYFAKSIRKFQANEIAYDVIQKTKKTEGQGANATDPSNVTPIK